MVDERGYARLHPDDRKAIIDAMLEGRAAERLPDKPPAYATGRDAQIFSDAARAEFDRLKTDLMREMRDLVRENTKDFLPEDTIQQRIEDAFDDIGLPIDKEHRRETAEAMRGMVKWQKRIDKVLGGMALAVVTAALYGLARLAGINIPTPGGVK